MGSGSSRFLGRRCGPKMDCPNWTGQSRPEPARLGFTVQGSGLRVSKN